MKLLLDTHVLLWHFEGRHHLSGRQERAVRKADAGNPLFISDITLWEIATLVELGRIRLAMGLRDWLDRATAPPLVQRVGISPAVAAEVAVLPATFHRDPADRVIVATARVLGATLVTGDERIIDSRLVPTLG